MKKRSLQLPAVGLWGIYPYMASPSFLSRTLIPLSAGLLICSATTSCQEHKKLASQTAEILQKVEELKAEQAEKEAASSASKSNHPLARKGTQALESGIAALEGDVVALQERKKLLETELATLQKDFADYRAKSN
ncbi:MAG: hypothetical protein ACAH88_06375 [Roseimicrobium sp.]